MDKVWWLNKALYGLKQSARAWYQELATELCDIGYQQSLVDHSVFFQKANDQWSILTIHTNDITGICSSTIELDMVKQEIGKFWKFKEKNTVRPVKILGILVTSSSNSSIFWS